MKLKIFRRRLVTAGVIRLTHDSLKGPFYLRYSITDLLVLPVLCVFTVPVGTTALCFGFKWFPWFINNSLEVRNWFIALGLSPNAAASFIPVYVIDIPAFFLISSLSVLLFLIGTRVSDSFALLLLLLYPFVDLFFLDPADANHLLAMFKIKLLSILTSFVLFCCYYALRRKRPLEPPSLPRKLSSAAFLGTVLLGSSLFWFTLDG
ncbi:hypothetical protein [Novipirellula caenicola]|uniref:Uncharacterized protein n=1 Tax=Novipirellula caenicola TaxID=1536901 RepID=A0ABP9W1D4_9BACT